MLSNGIRHFVYQTALFSRNAVKSVTEIRRNIWTDDSKQHYAENEKFLALFPDIVSSVTTAENLKIIPDIGEFANKLLLYNSAGHKMTRGLMTVSAYQMLEKPENITEESLRLARTLGWCVELIRICMLFLDDIIDNSSTRRGSICWYRLPDVGMRAVNDSSFLIALIFKNLKYNFSDKQYYMKLLNVFNEAILQMTIGQHLDCRAARNTSLFTEENYNNIAKYKIPYYTFKLPVFISSLLANRSYESVYKNEEDMLFQMGILISMKNDFMNCFAADQVAENAGTDIQDGKCTWLAVQALQRCSTAQRADFESCYGSADAARVPRVKQLYEQLQLPSLYHKVDRVIYDNIVNRIDAIPADNIIPPALIRKLFFMAYQTSDN